MSCGSTSALANCEIEMRPLDDASRRHRRAADTARWRSRQRRCVALYKVEAGSHEIDLAVRFGGLKESRASDPVAVSAALGRLLRRSLDALLRDEDRRR